MRKGQTLGSFLVMVFCYFIFALMTVVFFVILTPSSQEANTIIAAQSQDLETQRVLLGILRQPIGEDRVADQFVVAAKTERYDELDQRLRRSLDGTFADKKCSAGSLTTACVWKVRMLKSGREMHIISLEDAGVLVSAAKTDLPGLQVELQVFTRIQPSRLVS